MPYKNSIKVYEENRYYHLYARGVNKTPIFLSKEDYYYFLHLLKKYLEKDFVQIKHLGKMEYEEKVNTVYGELELVAYCLMKTHFHMLVNNIAFEGITKLMRRVLTNYTHYFNKKYSRQGPLFQGGYRAVLITSDSHFIQVCRYIHLSPVKDRVVKFAKDYEFSSIHKYLFRKNCKWFKRNEFLQKETDFAHIENYLTYVTDYDTAI